MDTLVAVGTTAAWAYSVVVTLWPGFVERAGIEPVSYFDSATIIIGLVLLGRWLEARRRPGRPARSGGSAGSTPATARLVRDGVDHEVALESVQVATCSASGRATSSRSTGSWSRAARPSTPRC